MRRLKNTQARFTGALFGLSLTLLLSAQAQAIAQQSWDSTQPLALFCSCTPGLDADAQLDALTQSLHQQLGDNLKLQRLSLNDLCHAAQDQACIVRGGLAQQAGAVMVIDFSEGDAITLRLLNTHNGLELSRATSADKSQQSLGAAGIKTLAAAGATGELVISDVQIFDKLRIDGHEHPVEADQTTVSLSVGQHSLELVRVGASTLRRIVMVPYAAQLRISAQELAPGDEKPPAAKAKPTPDIGSVTQTPSPVALGLIGGGALGLALAAGLGGHLAIYALPQLNWLQTQQDAGVGCSASGPNCWTEQVDAAQINASFETSAAVLIGLAGLAAVATGGWLLWQSQTELDQSPKSPTRSKKKSAKVNSIGQTQKVFYAR